VIELEPGPRIPARAMDTIIRLAACGIGIGVVNGFFVTGNGASARSAGAELTWTWIPIIGLSLSANAAYTDAYMTADAPAISAKPGLASSLRQA